MHRTVKGVIAKTLAVALALSLFGIQAPSSSAAKKPKLSKKKVTLNVKESKEITIKKVTAKKVKKLTVTSSKKKVATVKKKGKTAFTITGKKAGQATVTAKLTLKGKKKAKNLKVKVTVKAAPQPTKAPNPTTAPSTSPAPVLSASATPGASTTPETSTTPEASPSAPSENDVPTPKYTAAPNPGVKRITNKSSVQNPIINNISIWGVRDNPSVKSGYDYTQYGPYSGIITKWFEPKDSFKALNELFNAQVVQSLKSGEMAGYLTAGNGTGLKGAGEAIDPLGASGQTVKSQLKFISGPTTNLTTETASIEFVSRTGTANAANQKLTVVDGKTLTTTDGGGEPAVQVSGRANNWHGIQIDITDYINDPDKEYVISIDVTHKTSSKNGVRMDLEMAYENEDGSDPGEYPVKNQNTKINANAWTTLDFEYSIAGLSYAKHWLVINWYGEGEGAKKYDDFLVKNLTIQEVYSDKVNDNSETLAMSPLYTNTEDKYGFSLGAVIGNTTYRNEYYRDIIGKHFSSLTVDNDLKMYSLLDAEATKASEDGMPVLKENTSGEAIVKWAYENGIGVRGHTIICDTAMDTNCAYFFYEDYDTSKNLASKEVMLKRLESFITQCITYFEEKYPGTIHTWDLVNEAIETSSGGYATGDARKIQTKNNLFYDTIGENYVEYSFLYGRQAVNTLKQMYPDRNINIKLFYNDFNCYEMLKRDAICELAKSIQEFGQSQGMGNLIDGIGMQCYIGFKGGEFPETYLTTNRALRAQSIPNAVFKFHDLGCDVQFTELTIRNYDESKNAAQAEYYKKFMQMAIGINNGTITKVLE